jgi:hypothetical protein
MPYRAPILFQSQVEVPEKPQEGRREVGQLSFCFACKEQPKPSVQQERKPGMTPCQCQRLLLC